MLSSQKKAIVPAGSSQAPAEEKEPENLNDLMMMPAAKVQYSQRGATVMGMHQYTFINTIRNLHLLAQAHNIDLSGGKGQTLRDHINGMINNTGANTGQIAFSGTEEQAQRTLTKFLKSPPPTLLCRMTQISGFDRVWALGDTWIGEPINPWPAHVYGQLGHFSTTYRGDLRYHCASVARIIERYFKDTKDNPNNPHHLGVFGVILYFLPLISSAGRQDPEAGYMTLACVKYLESTAAREAAMYALTNGLDKAQQGQEFLLVVGEALEALEDILEEIYVASWKVQAAPILMKINSDLDNAILYLFEGIVNAISNVPQPKKLATLPMLRNALDKNTYKLVQNIAIYYARSMSTVNPELRAHQEQAMQELQESLRARRSASNNGGASSSASASTDVDIEEVDLIALKDLADFVTPKKAGVSDSAVDANIEREFIASAKFYADLISLDIPEGSKGIPSAILGFEARPNPVTNQPWNIMKDWLGLMYILALLGECALDVSLNLNQIGSFGDEVKLLKEANQMSKLLGGLLPTSAKMIENVKLFQQKLKEFDSYRKTISNHNNAVDSMWESNRSRAMQSIESGLDCLASVTGNVDKLVALAVSVQEHSLAYTVEVHVNSLRGKVVGDFVNKKLAKLYGTDTLKAYDTKDYKELLKDPVFAKASFVFWVQEEGPQMAVQRAQILLTPQVRAQLQLTDATPALNAKLPPVLPGWVGAAIKSKGKFPVPAPTLIDQQAEQQHAQDERRLIAQLNEREAQEQRQDMVQGVAKRLGFTSENK